MSRCRLAGQVKELWRAPQDPLVRGTAADPAGIPRAKRHAPVHVLCGLKARETVVGGVDACELGCRSLSGKRSRGDEAPENRPPFVRVKEMILVPEPAVALRLQPARASRGVRRTGQG